MKNTPLKYPIYKPLITEKEGICKRLSGRGWIFRKIYRNV